MRLAEIRPTAWNQVVGQERVIRLLFGVLRNQHTMNRGFIFEGSLGVGKTTVAYLFAKSLLCLGEDPTTCTTCSSCTTPLESHPDYEMVDAAFHSGVANARNLLDHSKSPAVLGKRKVILIDEAHNLTEEAWDVFLKPLEELGTDAIFLFVSNEANKIPEDIVDRCTLLHFLTVQRDLIIGLLANTAEKHGIKFDMDGLRYIAVLSKGRIRTALRMLTTVATIGPITLDLCQTILDKDAEDYSYRILRLLVDRDLQGASSYLQELSDRIGARRAVDALFTLFAKETFGGKSPITPHFRSIHDVTGVFLKWSKPDNLPADALSLLLLEIEDCLRPVRSVTRQPTVGTPQPTVIEPAPQGVSLTEILEALA